jgi:hypothetical protein
MIIIIIVVVIVSLHFILLLFAVTCVLGDETCDASVASDGSSLVDEIIRAPKVDDADVTNDMGGENEMTVRPTWWDYNIDQLFQDYFDCGSIIYGYNVGESGDDPDDDDSDEGAEEKKRTEHFDFVSEVQLQNLRGQWALLREKYLREVNLVPIREDGVPAIVVPSRIGDAGRSKGRGVFATEPIPKDTLIIELINGSTGIFKVGHKWREFAVSLPREIACNFIEWSWVQTLSPTSELDDDIRNGLTIFIAFDESNLMNNAQWDGVEANVRCGSPPKYEGGERGPCRFHYYAARDISAGEELLLRYSEFEEVSQQGWIDIGL